MEDAAGRRWRRPARDGACWISRAAPATSPSRCRAARRGVRRARHHAPDDRRSRARSRAGATRRRVRRRRHDGAAGSRRRRSTSSRPAMACATCRICRRRWRRSTASCGRAACCCSLDFDRPEAALAARRSISRYLTVVGSSLGLGAPRRSGHLSLHSRVDPAVPGGRGRLGPRPRERIRVLRTHSGARRPHGDPSRHEVTPGSGARGRSFPARPTISVTMDCSC